MNVRRLLIAMLLLVSVVSACNGSDDKQDSAPTVPAETLRYFDWAGYMSPDVLANFTAETGIKVEYIGYQNPADGVERIRAGEVFDVAVVETEQIPALINERLLALIDRATIPNFANVDPVFLGQAVDPSNQYSIPFTYYLMALFYVPTQVETPPTEWADLWNPDYGTIAIYDHPSYLIGAALRSLGHSVNTTDASALNEARDLMLALAPRVVLWSSTDELGALIEAGTVTMGMYSNAEDVIFYNAGVQTEFVYPSDGPLLYTEHLVIPYASTQRETAQRLIDYLLRPEVAAQIATYGGISPTNQYALNHVPANYVTEAALLVPIATLQTAELALPLPPDIEARHAELWAEFMAAVAAD